MFYSMLVDDDPCRSLPCQNSGQCKSLSSGYTCDCRPGTTGRQCETGICFCIVYIPCIFILKFVFHDRLFVWVVICRGGFRGGNGASVLACVHVYVHACVRVKYLFGGCGVSGGGGGGGKGCGVRVHTCVCMHARMPHNPIHYIYDAHCLRRH